MAHLTPAPTYRADIDGLRAIAVVSVVAFHFGVLATGFLGVDVFFVISGFLITGIISREYASDTFSLLDFYERRTRRIVPLVLVVCLAALLIGMPTMLPDDLENLAQSVIATNLFANNILQAITTRDYWDVVNEFKPLMHTWSLGVEEQFYLVFPVLLYWTRHSVSASIALLGGITLISFSLYCFANFEHYQKFYWIFFRFWELAVGGIAALFLRGRLWVHPYVPVLLIGLLLFLLFDIPGLSDELQLLGTVLLTCGLLCSATDHCGLARGLLVNPLAVFIGKISFSLYMWHQLVLAYARYFWQSTFDAITAAILVLVMLFLSVVTYRWVETPFRNRQRVNTRALIAWVLTGFILTTGLSLYLYSQSGVLRDVPELGVVNDGRNPVSHKAYNREAHQYDKAFSDQSSSGKPKLRVLVIGDSFARDWVNVLRESTFADRLDISYVFHPEQHTAFAQRVAEADLIFVARLRLRDFTALELPEHKTWVVGTKNFGMSNGIFYNYRGASYLEQRTPMESGYYQENQRWAAYWQHRYIDLVAKVIDDKGTVPVFTPEGQFIAHDCRHFTQAGARYFAALLEPELKVVLESVQSTK